VPTPRQVHRASTRAFSIVLVVLGLAIVGSTVARGGGALAFGVVFGALFVAAGAARLYLLGRGSR
jgi:hypothetical protein